MPTIAPLWRCVRSRMHGARPPGGSMPRWRNQSIVVARVRCARSSNGRRSTASPRRCCSTGSTSSSRRAPILSRRRPRRWSDGNSRDSARWSIGRRTWPNASCATRWPRRSASRARRGIWARLPRRRLARGSAAACGRWWRTTRYPHSRQDGRRRTVPPSRPRHPRSSSLGPDPRRRRSQGLESENRELMKPLKIGVSGVRGVVGETLTPDLIVGFAQAFGTYLGPGRILVCRDTRPSGPMVAAAVMAGLLNTGCDVVDLGICPTPSLQLAVRWLGADGGISITAGHNPAHWNALKFVRQDGLYLTLGQAEELLDIYHQGRFEKATWDRMRTRVELGEAIQHHLDVLSASFDLAAPRRRRLKVAVDCCNGSCSLLAPRWLATLGCEVLAINDDPSSPFPHTPDPKPAP